MLNVLAILIVVTVFGSFVGFMYLLNEKMTEADTAKMEEVEADEELDVDTALEDMWNMLGAEARAAMAVVE